MPGGLFRRAATSPKRTDISCQGTPVRNFQIHSLDEEPIAQLTIAPNTSGAARQQFLNPRDLFAAQSTSSAIVCPDFAASFDIPIDRACVGAR